MRLSLEQPPGIRSCRNGGTWEHAREKSTQRIHFIEDLKAYKSNSGISQNEWELLLAELRALLQAAERGDLNFDSTNQKGIVCQCMSAPDVLEMRIQATINFDGSIRQARLYFAEPEVAAHQLISLSLQFKQSSTLGLAEQNQHMAAANQRLIEWFTP